MKYSIQYIAAAIKKARTELGLSQRQVAAMTKIPQGHISLIESGKVNLEASSLVDLARALEHEVMIVPKHLVPLVHSLKKGKALKEQTPMYRLDHELEDWERDDETENDDEDTDAS